MSFALCEYQLEQAFAPGLKARKSSDCTALDTPDCAAQTTAAASVLQALGLLLLLTGEALRKVAMVTAGHNFTHRIAVRRTQQHVLVTSGVYSFSRHPGYLGWLLWAVGTQVLLQNPLSTPLFALTARASALRRDERCQRCAARSPPHLAPCASGLALLLPSNPVRGGGSAFLLRGAVRSVQATRADTHSLHPLKLAATHSRTSKRTSKCAIIRFLHCPFSASSSAVLSHASLSFAVLPSHSQCGTARSATPLRFICIRFNRVAPSG